MLGPVCLLLVRWAKALLEAWFVFITVHCEAISGETQCFLPQCPNPLAYRLSALGVALGFFLGGWPALHCGVCPTKWCHVPWSLAQHLLCLAALQGK